MSELESRRSDRIARLALAANTGVLFLLLLIAADARFLFETPGTGDAAPPVSTSAEPTKFANRVVLIVVDGLRVSTASDAAVMPFLVDLGRRGGRGIVFVENIVPSSIAAIDTITTGRLSPPAGFLADFKAPPADEGGIFAAITRAGRTSFVAGPALWTDRYGKWIAASEIDATFGSNDEQLLNASKEALENREDALLIVHFSGTDFAAHQAGADSAQYRHAAAWCDGAIEQIASKIGESTALVIVSDHGNRAGGGHAGREPSVVLTPLIVSGPGVSRGTLAPCPQSALGSLILKVIGLSTFEQPSVLRPDDWRVPRLLVVLAVSMVLSLRIWSTIPTRTRPLRNAFALNAAVWIALFATLSSQPRVALFAGLGVLLAVALRDAAPLSRIPVILLAAGVALGFLRLLDGSVSLDRAPREETLVTTISLGACLAAALVPLLLSNGSGGLSQRELPRPLWYSASLSGLLLVYFMKGPIPIYVGAVATGFVLVSLVRRAGVPSAGAFFVVASALLSRAAGETVSLSTIDVKIAFEVIEGRFGLALGIFAVMATQVVPIAGLLIGMGPGARTFDGAVVGQLMAAISAITAGEAITGSLSMLSSDPTQAALGLGLLLRCLTELVYTSLGFFFVLVATCSRLR